MIVNFISNCTRNDLVFIITHLVFSFIVFLSFYLLFISLVEYILIEFFLICLTPGLFNSILNMNISDILNPATPSPTGNNPGNLGSGGGGNGSGGNGGGDGGSSSVTVAGGNDSNNRHDGNQANSAPRYYPLMEFFQKPSIGRSAFIEGKNRELFFCRRPAMQFIRLHSNLFHDLPLEVYWTRDGKNYILYRLEPPKHMPYA